MNPVIGLDIAKGESQGQEFEIRFAKPPYHSHLFSMNMYFSMLLHYKEHLSTLEKQIDALAYEVEEYDIIQSIPGIGEKIAATIISEVGEVVRFNHPKKLVDFVGVDPGGHISGEFAATINRITNYYKPISVKFFFVLFVNISTTHSKRNFLLSIFNNPI